ncbi:hypothetical protein [Micromonospora sp. WMMC250]|uniref:hypothetical protein n=1 Tax=Micromonospora sp. WMMC250 TaxID=3014781 RepID=UPI0022B6A0B3|nr:hypothetical protein [Micromonospora sp. WMMC250]MCZ7376517.1 hypothetical protein [Micromonospora sp. WMMC250]
MSIDLRDGDVHAWAATPTARRITTRQWLTAHLAHLLHLAPPKPGGRRRVDPTRRPVPASYLLTPAAQQLATRTREQVHADVDQDTGIWAPRDITPTGAWTQPTGVASDGEIQQWVTDGAGIDDQTPGQVTA